MDKYKRNEQIVMKIICFLESLGIMLDKSFGRTKTQLRRPCLHCSPTSMILMTILILLKHSCAFLRF